MNKQDILNMKPGREFNLLISQKVLGITPDERKDDNILRDFSSDPSIIMTIINKLAERNFKYTITNINKYEHSCIFDSMKSHKRYIAHADNLIEAVCKAALLAVFGEEEYEKKIRAQEQ
ncbi:hypothetical protein [Fonticella tunisiensis]|uniref:Phage ABA sandwich domain-containing protein n=1 Tax=Fonticella tunisiensis TaxID=1096341 RepID=A0A4R7KQG4_9CLOT|nr:hypothetical protein [Fonticella tunisiensis]TDT58394.1 hypothetical protein EDD71_11129 [Fonticella tunisiensis]